MVLVPGKYTLPYSSPVKVFVATSVKAVFELSISRWPVGEFRGRQRLILKFWRCGKADGSRVDSERGTQ
jgi:hypothetical protein